MALLAASRSERRAGAIIGGVVIVAAAGAAEVLRHQHLTSQAIVLALFVPLASVGVLVAVRERLEREAKRLRHSALSDPLRESPTAARS